MQILNISTDILISFLYLRILNYFFDNQYSAKIKNNLIKCLFQFIFIYLIFNNHIFSIYKFIFELILIFMLFIWSSLFYNIHSKTSYIKDVLTILMCILFIFGFIITLSEIVFEIVYTDLLLSIIKFPKVFLNAITLYLSYIIISLHLQYKNPKFEFNFKTFKIISLLISVLYASFVLLNIKEIFLFPRIYKTMIFTFIIYNISLIAFNRYQTKHDQIERRLSLEKQRIEDEKKYLNKLLQADEDIRKLRHDLTNTYTILQGHLNAGEYDKAKAFVDKHAIKIEKASALIHTGFSSIDSVLEEKIQKMNRKNIIYHEFISNLNLGNISESELAMIIALAFDNAIEAAEQVNNHKEVQFKISNHINFIVFEISNSIILGSHPNFGKTSKLDESHLHGYGVKGIKEYISHYKGEMFYDIQDDKVSLKIILNTNP